MSKQYVLGVVLLGAVACGGSLPPDQALARSTTDVARVDVVEGRECGAGASVKNMPDHCALSPTTGRTWLLSAEVQFVASVDAEGRPNRVKVLKAPAGYDLEDAVVDCAMHASYSVPTAAAGQADAETCPVTLRLRRYASDSGRAEPPPIPCPVVQPYSASASSYGGGGSMGVPSGTNCVSR